MMNEIILDSRVLRLAIETIENAVPKECLGKDQWVGAGNPTSWLQAKQPRCRLQMQNGEVVGQLELGPIRDTTYGGVSLSSPLRCS